MGMRVAELDCRDPFTRKDVWIRAPVKEFLSQFGFGETEYRVELRQLRFANHSCT